MAGIKEVAAKAGVSVTTVSRTLNNRGYISDAMRKRIQDAMDELHYRPNEVARSLTRQRTRIIGVLVPEISNAFFCEVIAELSKILTQRNYRMMLYQALNLEDKAAEYIAMLEANQVDGMIVALRGEAIGHDLRAGFPVVSFERLKIDNIPTVECDNEMGGYLAGRELLDCGCRKPVMVWEKHSHGKMPAFDRFAGFSRCMEERNLPVEFVEVRQAESRVSYDDLARRVFREYPDADGVFCTSDTIASYLMQEALRLHKRIPEDLKVVGFNDNVLASMLSIPLTSIRQPIHDMCEAAVDCLMKQIHQEPFQTDMIFPVTISPRVSTRGYQEEANTEAEQAAKSQGGKV